MHKNIFSAFEASKTFDFYSDFVPQIFFKALKTAFYCPEKQFGKKIFRKKIARNISRLLPEKIQQGCQNYILHVQWKSSSQPFRGLVPKKLQIEGNRVLKESAVMKPDEERCY